MFYNVGDTVEAILKDRQVSGVTVIMEDNGPNLTVWFDEGQVVLQVNTERFELLGPENANLDDAKCAGLFGVSWDELDEHTSFPDVACRVTTWK